ncbi:MAG: DNRLRE domain-containing protein [Anaerolineae bacterium]|nr:DNRLRE domain-containing protein [Anaerolineae bacterium]
MPLIAKSVSSATASPDDILTYSIDVQNPGSELLSNVVVSDVVPAGTSYVAGSANAGGTEGAGVVTWDLGSNDAGTIGAFDGYDYFATTILTNKDTYLDQKETARNYGASTTLVVDPRSGEAARPLIEYDLSGIPSNAEVTFAYMELFQTAVEGSAGTINLQAYGLTQDWAEGTGNNTNGEANWNNRLPATPWTTPGGTTTGVLAGSVNVTLSTGGTEFELIITDLVQDWVDGTLTNRGVLLRAQNETGGDNQRHIFSSSDGTLPPELIINYRVPNGPVRTTQLSAEGTLAGDNNEIKITMELTSTSTITNVTPSALTVIGANGASADNCSAPSPAGPFTVVAGTPTFVTYTCDAVAGTNVGDVRFRADATTAAGYTFKQATSNSVIVAPTLTFNVKVDRPPTADPILNSAVIADDGVIPATTSNVVQTDLRAAIGDTLWYDANANGIQDPGELGIPGVELILTGPGGTITTTTDANGIYVFGDLDAGTYTVTVNEATLPVSAVQTYDLDGLLDGKTTVTLTDGEWQGDADFGYNPQLIVKEVDLTEAAPNDTLTYTSTVIYPFDAKLTNVTVTDTIPVGTTYVPSSASPTLTTGPDPLVWTIGSNTDPVNGLAYVCADSTTLIASQATWIDQDKPTENKDNSNLEVKDDTNEPKDRHTLVQFDLSALPTNADISSALLGMHVQTNKNTLTVNVNQATGSWNEATVTWNTAPAAGTNYGSFIPDPKDVYIDTDITALVTGWVDGSITNNGLRLTGTSPNDGDTAAFFDEDETDKEPRLTVNYEYISPDGCLQTVRIPAQFDTFIDQDKPSDDNSTDDPLLTRPESGVVKRALMQFDLASYVPSGAVIDDANLVVTSRNSRSNHTVNLYRVTKLWAATATWNTPWTSPGGDFDSGTSYGTLTPNATQQSVDVTPLVVGWGDGTFSNYGIVLAPTGTDNGDAQWASSTDGTVSRRPYLEVTFRSPSVTTTLPVTQDTYIEEDDPAANNGAANEALTRPVATEINRALFQFDTGALPTGATVTDATVYINSNNTRANHQVQVRQVTSAWTGAANWTTTNGTTAWSSAGGDFTGAYGTMQPTANDTYQPADVTGLVQLWVDGTPNYGLLLDPIGTDNGDAQWNTLDEGNFPAYIEVTYEAAIFGGSSMNIDRALVSDGDTFNVTLTLTATTTVTDVTPSALSVTDLNMAGGSASCDATPTPATQDVPAGGSATFTWSCTASAGSEPSNLTFSASAGGGAGGLLTFAEATSDSILIAPPYVFQVTVNDPLEVGRVDNISYLQDESDTIPPTPSNEVQTSMGPDLIVVKTSDPTTVNVGDTLQYTLVITNQGQSDATGVVVTDTLPAEVTYVNAVSSQGSCSESAGLVTCNIGTLLANGGSATVTIDVTVDSVPSGAAPLLPPAAPAVELPAPGPTTVKRPLPSAPNPNVCYAVGDGSNQLVTINRITGTPTTLIGNTGVNLIEAIVMALDGETVYAANGSTFGTLNTSTGAYTSIGSFGTGTGALGSKFFSDVDGLAIDAQSGIFYGTVRTNGTDGAPDDLLIQINPTTGAHVPNAFGTNVDYVVINTTSLGLGLNDVDDIAVDPRDGQMYAVANVGGGTSDHLIKVNKTNGSVIDVAAITNSAGGGNVNDMEGFSFFNDGTFYGTTGDGSSGGNEDSLWQIDETTGVATLVGQFSIDSDYEAVGCLTAGSNTFSGLVFEDIGNDGNYNPGTDIPTSGVTVNLWIDEDGSGDVSAGDVLIQSVVSAGDGTYSFETGLTGDFVIEVDQTTLPANAVGISTVGEYGVSLTLYGNDTTGLNFGYFTEAADLAVTKTVNNATPNEDETITYTIVATNNGPDAATGVVVNDTLPTGVTYVSHVASTGTYAAGVWTVGSLAASSSETLTITAKVDLGTLGDTIINAATITGNETDPNLNNNATTEPLEVVCLADSIYNVVEVSSNEFDADAENNVSSACTVVLPLLETGDIGNRVWLDENGDGIQDAGEDGIANVVVTLTPPADVDLGNGLGQPITTTTGADGGYIFTDLPPNETYTVTIAAPAGMVPTYDEDDGTTAPNNETVVTLQPGEEHLTSDFGLNWVPPKPPNPADIPSDAPGAIGDTIWNDANGDGVQDPGEIGLGGITVTLYSDPDGDGVYDTVVDTTTTDDSGHYIFDDLAPGAYVVAVDPTNLPAGWNPTPTGDPDGDGDNVSEPIILAPGDVYVNADWGYQPTDPGTTGSTIGDQIFLDVDGDGIQDAGEPGLPGVTVSLLDDDGDVVGTTTTDENGNYEFPNLPAGTYTVVVTDTDNVLGDLTPISNPVDDTGPVDNQGSPITVDGTAGDSNDVQDFGYAPPGHDPNDTNANGIIGDTVFIDTDGDGMLSAGEGVQGVTVTLEDSSGNTVTTVTDRNGNYTFGSLDPLGTYTVTVDTSTLPNGGSGLYNTVDPIDDSTPSGDSSNVVDLSASGGVNLDQDFGYSADDPATPGTDEGNHIEGTVWEDTDADGTLDTPDEPGRYEGVTIELWEDTNNDGVIGPEDNLIGTTTTDVNGDYSFEGLPPGNYLVDVTDEDNVLAGTWHSDGPNDGANNNSQDDPYDITFTTTGETNDTADFGYYSEPAALGDFVWADDGDGIQEPGEPGIPGVPVTLTITYPNGDVETVHTVTDANGLYSFPNLLLDEDYNGTGTPGSGGTTPSYVVNVDTPNGLTQTLIGQGDGSNDSDDGVIGAVATPLQGSVDDTNDFGYQAQFIDMGDLPNDGAGPLPDYPTLFADAAATVSFPDTNADNKPDSLNGVAAVWLGDVVDYEANGQPSADADGDDLNGIDDEDGVIFTDPLTPGSSTTMTVSVSSSAATNVNVGIWIDWDADGVFDTFITSTGATDGVNPTDVPVSIPVPAGYGGTEVYYRVRAFPGDYTPQLEDVSGTFINGEVEDYKRPGSPTGVTLRESVAGIISMPMVYVVVFVVLMLLTIAVTVPVWRRRGNC